MISDKTFIERKLFSPKKEHVGNKIPENPGKDEDMLIDNFTLDRGSSLNINCNIVSILPDEYNHETKVEEPNEVDEIEIMKHKPVCYYVLNKGVVDE